MLSALEMAKRNGAKIVAINPLREAGLVRYKNPQQPKGLVGYGTERSDLLVPQDQRRHGAVPGTGCDAAREWDALDHGS